MARPIVGPVPGRAPIKPILIFHLHPAQAWKARFRNKVAPPFRRPQSTPRTFRQSASGSTARSVLPIRGGWLRTHSAVTASAVRSGQPGFHSAPRWRCARDFQIVFARSLLFWTYCFYCGFRRSGASREQRLTTPLKTLFENPEGEV